MAKVYTKTGDLGETGLVGGQRVAKNHPRIEAYGTVDELNSQLGLLIFEWSSANLDREIQEELTKLQHQLFNIGSFLACPPDKKNLIPEVDGAWVNILETSIDKMSGQLEPLKAFILPGGGKVSSICHICRTVSRRAERNCLFLAKESSDKDQDIFRILNRLSDYFFVLARYANKLQNVSDVEWQK